MARLTKDEMVEIARLKRAKPLVQPPVTLLSPRAYVEFATFASRLAPVSKPVRFEGTKWRL